MKRFFLDLEGASNLSDPRWQLFNSEREAVLVAERLAQDLAESRPDLKRKPSITVLKQDQRKYSKVPI